MVRQDNLSPTPGSKHARKRVGRGDSSGHGSYSGKGIKGQKSRTSPDISPAFEGGQLPLIKRLPRKRGFTNIFKVEYSLVNVGELDIFEPGSEVTPEKLLASGIIKSLKNPLKVLADGDLSRPLVVKANKFSASAKAKIEAVGGKVEEVENAAQAK